MDEPTGNLRRPARWSPLTATGLGIAAPRARFRKTAARMTTIGLLFASAGSLLLLHLLRRDLNPIERRLSEYAIGPYGVLMTAALFAMGLALGALSVQLAAARSASGIRRLVAPLIGVAGVGLILAGIFRTGTDSLLVEIIHSRASGAAVLALTGAAVASVTGPATGRQGRASRAVTVAAVVAVAIGPILHDTRWSGIGQRVVWLALAAWLLITAWQPRTDQ